MRKLSLLAGAPVRHALVRTLATLFASVSVTQAATRLWTGTPAADALWSNATYWGGAVPTSLDDAFFNSAGSTARIDGTVAAVSAQLSLGRHAANTSLAMSGGSLAVSGEVFIGQYSAGSGWLDLSGGTINAASHFTVGSAGTGDFTMSGGALNVGGTLFINRYAGVGIDGHVDITGGAVSANTLSIGPAGKLEIDNATLTLNGDRRTLLNGYLGSGALTATWSRYAAPTLAHDAGANRTTFSMPRGRSAGIDVFTPAVVGARPITYDYTGVRRLKPAPAPGVHPRIYFDAADLPDIRARLNGTAFGQEVMRMIKAQTLLLRKARTAPDGYNSLPLSTRTMADGTALLANTGIFDQSAIYQDLINGGTSQLAAMAASSEAKTRLYAMGGQFALEAFECLVEAPSPAIATRQANLASAFATWADWAVAQPDYAAFLRSADFKFGGHSTSLAYDLLFNQMTPTQRDKVRKALASMLKSYLGENSVPTLSHYSGVQVAPEVLTSNWAAIDTFKLVLATAIEGEVVVADAGYSAADIKFRFEEGMTTFHKFFTYGWYSNGSPYEGQGKNYVYATHLIPLARRGYDFFGHPHVREYGRRWMPAVVEPYGYGFTKYDVLGGNGLDLNGADVIGMKWMYPGDPGVDFMYRNAIHTAWVDANGVRQTFIDPRKFTSRSVYQNDLLAAAIFAQDVASTQPWATQNAAALGALDYLDVQGGNLIARSGYDTDAARLMVHVRQDFGGHTTADRNSFNFGALGRTFIQHRPEQDSNYHSVVHVNGLSMKVTDKDGDKLRIPGKLAAWKTESKAAFVTGDATYAYTNEWFWRNDGKLSTGFVYDSNTFNHFRRTGNKISDSFANVPFKDLPHWFYGGFEGIQKKPYQPMAQVYRTIGLVRSGKPYVLVVDDVRKDAATHTYKWFASLQNDLALTVPSPAPANYDPATDVVLKETGGNRCLLVRILRAKGTVQKLGAASTELAYIESIPDPTPTKPAYNRLVIERGAVVDAEFRVLLFPFRVGDALPANAWSGAGESTLTVSTTTTDLFDFVPRTETIAGQTVTMSEFNLTAGGTPFGYTNLVEPIPVR